MNVQLLLLLALVGPFCAFTHASPTMLTTDLDSWITETFAHVTTEAAVSPAHSTGPPTTELALTTDEVTPSAFEDNTVLETDALVTRATTTEPKILTITPSVLEAEVPTEPGKTDGIFPVIEAETDGGVVVEENVEEGLSSGQVVGIVIGALVAVVIVIAMVIAVARRMGKYSP